MSRIAVPGATSMGNTTRLRLAAGDRIRFLARHRGLGVFNGTCATIQAIDLRPASPRLSVLIETPDGGRKASFLLSDLSSDLSLDLPLPFSRPL